MKGMGEIVRRSIQKKEYMDILCSGHCLAQEIFVQHPTCFEAPTLLLWSDQHQGINAELKKKFKHKKLFPGLCPVEYLTPTRISLTIQI